MSLPPIANIFTVSRLNTTVRQLLEKEMGLVWISAEISNFTQPASGHWYFTLKDMMALRFAVPCSATAIAASPSGHSMVSRCWFAPTSRSMNPAVTIS